MCVCVCVYIYIHIYIYTEREREREREREKERERERKRESMEMKNVLDCVTGRAENDIAKGKITRFEPRIRQSPCWPPLSTVLH